MKKLTALLEALESNIMDGDHSSIESNATELADMAKEMGVLLEQVAGLVDTDMGDAADWLIDNTDNIRRLIGEVAK